MQARYRKCALTMVGVASLVFAVTGSITVTPDPTSYPLQVSDSANPPAHFGLEPSSVSPTVPGSTWVHAYMGDDGTSHTAMWNGSLWVQSVGLYGDSQSLGDPFVAYDAGRNQYLFMGTAPHQTRATRTSQHPRTA